MSRSTISARQIFRLYPDEVTAHKYIESRRWPSEAICPSCEETQRITPRKNGFYRCNACKKDFTVRTGTIFERSHVELHRWVYAMYLLMTAPEGISSLQLSKEIGVTQKTAWFMLGRIREACGDNLTILRSTIDVGGSRIGGREKNKTESKRSRKNIGDRGEAVLDVKQRGGSRYRELTA